jgi:predicted transposase YbfD/YdcC
VEDRKLWSKLVDGAAIGLAGAAQIFRIDTKTDYLRRGKVIKTTEDIRYGVSSLCSEQADSYTLLNLVRGYWGIEIQQHYRRDYTQREDHCHVRNPTSARNLSLMRSIAIFLYERQRRRRAGKRSLPDWQAKNHRNPNHLIGLLTTGAP